MRGSHLPAFRRLRPRGLERGTCLLVFFSPTHLFSHTRTTCSLITRIELAWRISVSRASALLLDLWGRPIRVAWEGQRSTWPRNYSSIRPPKIGRAFIRLRNQSMFTPSACLFMKCFPVSHIPRRHKLNIPPGARWAATVPWLRLQSN